MLKYSLTFPIILSCLYIFFSQGQYTLPTCALSCAQTAGNEVGCNSCVSFSIRTMPLILPRLHDLVPDPPCCRNDTICVCTDNSFIEVVSLCVEEDCSESDAQTAVDYWDIVCGYNSGNHPPSIIDPSFIDNSSQQIQPR